VKYLDIQRKSINFANVIKIQFKLTIKNRHTIMNNKRFENFSKQDLEQLRKEIVLNSLYISDYNNSFNIDPHSVCDFFDGFISHMEELASEINPNMTYEEMFVMLDNTETLFEWYSCFEDFSWVNYIED